MRRVTRRILLLEKQGPLMRRGAFSAAGDHYREGGRPRALPGERSGSFSPVNCANVEISHRLPSRARRSPRNGPPNPTPPGVSNPRLAVSRSAVALSWGVPSSKGFPMPDIQLRFRKDMLVLSAPVSAALARDGLDVARDLEFTLLFEPDVVEEACRLESIAGAQCLVAPTAGVTPARLAAAAMDGRGPDVVCAALAVVRSLRPQPVLAAIGPCGLPLDGSSKASMTENREQYARAARLFAGEEVDGFLLEGFAGCADLMCALAGLRKVTDAPILASVDVDGEGMLANGRDTLEAACAVMADFEASVAGFATAAGQDEACALARRAGTACDLPLMASLVVGRRDARQQGPTPENPYYCPDTMVAAADALRAAGVQFLRAAGDATPAYTGALVATTVGLDVRGPAPEAPAGLARQEALDDLAASMRERVSAALGTLAAEADAAAATLTPEERRAGEGE